MTQKHQQHQVIYRRLTDTFHRWTYWISAFNSLCPLNTSHTTMKSTSAHHTTAQWAHRRVRRPYDNLFFFFCCRKPAKAALLTGSLAESGLATKDVFHPQWLRRYLQEAATFPYLAPDKALCHSTVYHYQRQRIHGFFPLKWRAVWDSAPHIYSNTELCTMPCNFNLNHFLFSF